MPEATAHLEEFRNIFVQLFDQPVEVVENERLEIKGWCHDERELAEKIVEAASCIANAKGGIVLAGIEGKRSTFSSCPYPNVNPSWIEARVKDNSVPPVDCEVYDLSELLASIRGVVGANVFGLVIPKTQFLGTHITAKGISKIRVGKECRPYFTTADDDRTKAIVQGTSAADLSMTSIQWAMTQHQKKFKTGVIVEEPLEFLAKTRLIEAMPGSSTHLPQYKVTLAAVILFGKEATIHRTLPFFETVISLNGQYSRIRRNAVESVREIVFSERSIIRRGCPQVSQLMVQELLMNAYVHRCWRTAAPVMINIDQSFLEFENPGELLPGLHVSSLLHCIPAYRNLLLAEGGRFIGLCDKVGKGIDVIFESALEGGLDVPIFESGDNRFSARLSLVRSDHFREFVRRRAAVLSNTDEILALRTLWAKPEASVQEIASVLQRGFAQTARILAAMEKKIMIEPLAGNQFRLAPNVRFDVEHIFEVDQMSFDLFGG